MSFKTPLIRDPKHQEELASQVNARLRQKAKERRENRKRQEGVEIPAHHELTRRPVEVAPSPAFGTSGGGYRSYEPIHRNRPSGSEKRRKRRGGKPSGPGLRGAGMRSTTPRSRRGYLVRGSRS